MTTPALWFGPKMSLDVLLVVLVVALITYLPVSTEILLALKHFPITRASLALHLLFGFSVLMIWYNYWRAVSTDPGLVPDGWLPEEHSTRAIEVKVSSQGPRYCRNCNVYKPPRSHHCSHCKRCVLRMDHHCPWINNCVGFGNNHYFFRFLFYVVVASNMCLGALGYILFRWIAEPYKFWYSADVNSYELGLTLFNLLMTLPVTLCVTPLFLYNLFYMVGNYTTIEKLDKQRKAFLYQNGCVWGLENPYDLGCSRNICSVLGENPLLWLLFQLPLGSGTDFRFREESVSESGIRIFGPAQSFPASQPLLQHASTGLSTATRVRSRSNDQFSPTATPAPIDDCTLPESDESDGDNIPLALLSRPIRAVRQKFD